MMTTTVSTMTMTQPTIQLTATPCPPTAPLLSTAMTVMMMMMMMMTAMLSRNRR
jgi:hypothetical protein